MGLLAYALVAWLPSIIDTYQRTAESKPALATTYLVGVSIGGLVLLGISLFFLGRMWRNSLAKQRDRTRRSKNPSALSPTERRAELDANLARSEQFTSDAAADEALREQLKTDMEALAAKRETQRLEIVAFGTISSGKSSLLNSLAGREVFSSNVVGGTTSARSEIPWPGSDSVVLVDTPGLAEVRGESRAAIAAAAANTADLVLLVVDGPLKSYEVELVEVLFAMEKRLLVCLNKEDWYDPAEQKELLAQISEQLPNVEAPDVVAVRAAEVMRPRVRVLADGTEKTEYVPTPPDVTPLARRMLRVIEHDGKDMLLANLLLQSRGLVDEAKDRVREQLDKRADEIITKYMWAAGGAAGINPFPLLDLAGGSAITMKMVLDLAKVYRQKLDVDMAAKMLEQLGKNLIAMVGATVATPAVAAGIGSLLKTVPGIGTIAGGLVQGVTQALVTRWIGNVFVEYLRNEMKPPGGGLAEIARDQWEKLTRPQNLKKLIQLGRDELDHEEQDIF
ncbi:GTPase Era [Adhaeretor mobilis]|uniref:GTPase Era n=2 Tax=Adhaeretor mobilis TaxID=1930276 RepID=A0A517N1T3_9BACT|nr:GTPase Era [Adhaeretor mobilis]